MSPTPGAGESAAADALAGELAPPVGPASIDAGGAVRAGEELDAAAVTDWLRAQGENVRGNPRVTQFSGGASNWTYRLEYDNADLILRRPPAGTKAKSAHDMGREFRVQKALRPAYPFVPEMIGLCTDPDVLGVDFYVMRRVEGMIPRKNFPPGATPTPEQARQLCRTMLDRLVELHAIDPHAVGLDTLGRGAGYTRRQVTGWIDRYNRAVTWNVPSFHRTQAWLLANIPDDTEACLIHNDWRFDNLVLSPDDPTEIRAVLDWEMATVGDPLMDLGSALAYWAEATDRGPFRTMRRQPTDVPGMFTRDEAVAYYAERSGRDLSNWRFYEVFGLFRLAGIIQQIYYRYHTGQTDNPAFKNFWLLVLALDWRCLRRMREAA